MRLLAAFALGLCCAVACAWAQPALPTAAPTPREQFAAAVGLAKAGKHAEALPLLDALLKSHPGATKARFVRAKVRFRVSRFDEALEDIEQVVREAPNIAGGKELLEQVRARVKPITVTVVGGKAKYSEWVWSWTISGDKPFTLGEFKGAEGHTLFYWPAPADKAAADQLELDASDRNLFFLRVVKAELTQPAAKDHGVKAVPFMVLVDEAGAEVIRGDPAAVAPKLDAVKKVRQDAQRSADPLTHVDLSQTVKTPEELGRNGYTTVVMLSSPG